jgi:hypothetical protein
LETFPGAAAPANTLDTPADIVYILQLLLCLQLAWILELDWNWLLGRPACMAWIGTLSGMTNTFIVECDGDVSCAFLA